MEGEGEPPKPNPGFWAKLARRKIIEANIPTNDTSHFLSTISVIMIGIGDMAAGGSFVLLGSAALMAGPAVIISFIVGAFVAVLTGMCYAEFASTIPKAGSGYLYSYVALGEFVAFVVGWQVTFEELISAASVTSAISGSIDYLAHGAVTNWTINNVGTLSDNMLARHPDLLALGIGILVTVIMCCGIHKAALLGRALNSLELLAIIFCIVAGFIFADGRNWRFVGFAPNGFAGIMKAAAAVFFGFIGFETIVCAGEETAKPQRTIPLALFASLGIMMVLYILLAAAITLMIPFYKIDYQAAFPEAFTLVNYPVLGYVIAVAIVIGLIGGLCSKMDGVFRITYAMSQDGLLFSIFAKVNKRTGTPIVTQLFWGSLAATFACIFDLEMLVEYLSVGSLFTYTIVAAASIVLHYQARVTVYDVEVQRRLSFVPEAVFREDNEHLAGTLKPQFGFLRFLDKPYPGFAIDLAIVMFALFVAAFICVFDYAEEELANGAWWAILLAVLFGLGFLTSFLVISAHHRRRLNLPFKLRCVPFIPALSMALNIYLMSTLSALTWMRFSIWLGFGIVVYFVYGIRHSHLGSTERHVLHRLTSLRPMAGERSRLRSRTDSAQVDMDEETPLLRRTSVGNLDYTTDQSLTNGMD